jgi:hypothetical protein
VLQKRKRFCFRGSILPQLHTKTGPQNLPENCADASHISHPIVNQNLQRFLLKCKIQSQSSKVSARLWIPSDLVPTSTEDRSSARNVRFIQSRSPLGVICQKLSILHCHQERILLSFQRIMGWRCHFYHCMRHRHNNRCFCNVVWCFHMKNIKKRHHRQIPIRCDNSLRRLKHMCAVTLRIPIIIRLTKLTSMWFWYL